MRGYGPPEKDREAEALINQAVRPRPMRPTCWCNPCWCRSRPRRPPSACRNSRSGCAFHDGGQAGSRAGSFLGGLFGGGRPVSQPGASSVPVIGSRAAAPPPPAYDQDQQRPWAQSPPQQQAGPMGGGGFLRSAMATAAGVAGGMLAAGAIRDLMGGNCKRQHQCHSTGHQRGTGAAGSRAGCPARCL